MYFPHGLIASLNCISLITNTSSFYFVSKVYNIRDIVHYRILAIESATVCFFSLLSCILNVSITLDLNPFSDGYKCAFLTVTTGIPLFIGVVSSALTAFFRSVKQAHALRHAFSIFNSFLQIYGLDLKLSQVLVPQSQNTSHYYISYDDIVHVFGSSLAFTPDFGPSIKQHV